MLAKVSGAKHVLVVAERTDGITASFVKELVRASTVLALEGGEQPVVVRDEHFAAALDELLDESGVLTARLLGGAADRPPPSTFASSRESLPSPREPPQRFLHRAGSISR